MATKKTPQSIESILAQQKAKDAENKKPRFMTKAQREALQLEQKKQEEQLKAEKAAEAAKKREELERQLRGGDNRYAGSSSSGQNGYSSYNGRRDDYRGRNDYRSGQDRRDAPTAPRAMRGDERQYNDMDVDRRNGAGPSTYSSNGQGSSSSNQPDSNVPIHDPNYIKARYLGDKSGQKRKVRKQSDKKFVFDWDKDEDTAVADEIDPLYLALRAGDPNGSRTGTPTMTEQARMLRQQQNESAKPENGDDEPLAGPKALVRSSKPKPGIIDERHWSEKSLEEMKDRDWRIFKEDFSIAARGGNIPLPIRYWHEAKGIPQEIQDIIAQVGYKEPSAIQRQAIPIGLNVRDMIGIAETGSGKTAAFLIPMLTYISKLPPLSDANRHMGPYALVLAPTRELAQQIEQEAKKFTSRLGYKCVSIVGGRQMEEQALQLRDGAEIIIATPGRLKDCIERSIVVFGQCTYVVMDEADKMIGLGFEDVINFILDTLPVSNLKPDTEEAEDAGKMLQSLIGKGQGGSHNEEVYMYRQTMLFSATMPAACERLARKYLRRPAIVTIGVAGQAVDSVEQRVEFIAGDDKRKNRLIEILSTEGFQPPIIVFVNTKQAVDKLSKDLNRSGWSSTTLHSGKTQEQREAALKQLRDGEVDILVATDLAGRGIDVQDVSLVVNFQMSNTIEAYVHRIGRTGRAGKKGVAVTFLGNEDAEVMYDLKQELTKSPISKVPSELARHEAAQSKMSHVMKRKADEMGDQ
ncbi:DEAD-domain-containing protein [Cystobasidium minutum MCA 4210]|uniref:DEAD-domain-containing protein n=1 Tax=Cystobasidium minutum MCA 4210 TaxID=1397322 RepID=UPI0034CD7930|eukprot:jgi/Rhomi1/193517/gm1.1731_g